MSSVPKSDPMPAVSIQPLLLWSTVALLLATVAAAIFTKPKFTIGECSVNMQLPAHVLDYTGTDMGMSQAERDQLPPDTQIVRSRYWSPANRDMLFTIVLSGANRQSIHRPEVCLPSQGWAQGAQNVLTIPLKNNKSLQVTDMWVSHPGNSTGQMGAAVHAHFMFWFVGQNTSTPSHFTRVALGIWDKVMLGVMHRWAYLSLFALDRPNSTPEENIQRMKSFIAEIAPAIGAAP